MLTPPRYAHLPLLLGPDGRSSPSATAPPRCRSCATRATCPRPSITTSPCSAPGSPPTRSTSRCDELAERFRLERVSKNPAIFDERKLRHINGRWLRELQIDELTRRLEAFTARTGLRGAVEISAREDPDAGRVLAAGRVPVRRARSMTRRPSPRRSAPTAGRRCCATPVRRSPPPSHSRSRTIEAALREVVRAARAQAGQGLPAGTRRHRRNHRVARASLRALRSSVARRR